MASKVEWVYCIDRTQPDQTFGKRVNEISKHRTLLKAEENKPIDDEIRHITHVVVKRRK